MSDYKSAIIGACAALAGVALSQAMTVALSVLEKRHKRRILLREKYEEMMFHFSDSLQWIQTLQTCRTRVQIDGQAQSPPARKALSLCILYFPELAEIANQYISAQATYYKSVCSTFDETLLCSAIEQASANEEGRQLAANLMHVKCKFEEKILSAAKKYTRA